MIVEYHRPETLDQALELLARTGVETVPLGGGTILNQPDPNPVAVVDLQTLGLNTIEIKGKRLELGATVTLQQLLDNSNIPIALKRAIRHEATYNIRQVATIAGALVASDGRSAFTTAMLALGAELAFGSGDTTDVGSFLPLRSRDDRGVLITAVNIPNNVNLAYEYVARTPADLPIVCVAVAQWPSGRTRVALGGFDSAPLLAMDGPESDGAEMAARDAFREAGDQWASAEYRSNVAETLVQRCLSRI
jgi:probable selenate reductase FAD-binding subunit